MADYKPNKILDPNTSGYDFREVYKEGKNEKQFFEMGKNTASRLGIGSVIVGRDVRFSSPALYQAYISGLQTNDKIRVIKRDVCPTPVVFLEGQRSQTDCVAVVTASHVRKDYNGIKINFFERKIPTLHELILDSYKKSSIDFDRKYLSVVIDPLHGTFGNQVAKKVMENFGYNVTEIHGTFNPNFTFSGAPDCHDDNNLEDLVYEVGKLKSDFGVAFDGDGDRLRVVDEKGTILSENEVGALLAKYFVGMFSGVEKPKIVTELKCSQLVRDVISAEGGEYVESKTGRNHLKNKMNKSGAVFAFEISGHNYFHRDVYPVHTGDDGLFSAMIVGDIIKKAEKPLSQIVNDINRGRSYYSPSEERVHMEKEDSKKVIEALKKMFSDNQEYSVDTTDGIRVQRGRSWGLVRPSSNVPELTMVFESDTKDNYTKFRNKFIEIIKG
jgi:phosphomannomutase